MARRYKVLKAFDGDRRYVPGEVIEPVDWSTDNVHSLLRGNFLMIDDPAPSGVEAAIEEHRDMVAAFDERLTGFEERLTASEERAQKADDRADELAAEIATLKGAAETAEPEPTDSSDSEPASDSEPPKDPEKDPAASNDPGSGQKAEPAAGQGADTGTPEKPEGNARGGRTRR